MIQEPGGGGAVIAPYVRINGELYVGANKVSRHLTGRLITELPRGAANVGEAHSAVAKRELMEETGAVESVANRVKPLGGPVNPNSTFFKTDIGKGEGVKLFEIELRPEELTLRRDSEDPRRRVYILKPESQGEITEKDEGISPKGLRFFHISLLAGSPDSFTLAALARLQNKK